LAKSYLWRQILADVFAQEITVPASYESTCLGAAVLGLYALKKIPSLDVVSQMLGKTEQQQPNRENVEIYQKMIPLYSRLLHHLQDEYANIAQLQEELAGALN
jgi:gluconokinase